MPLASYTAPLIITERPNTDTSGTWTTVTATGPGSGTLSSWVEIDASTTADMYGMLIGLPTTRSSGQNSSAQIDIGVGAASSEVMVAERLSIGYGAGSPVPTSVATNGTIATLTGGQTVFVPIFIPAGSRVSFRMRDVRNGIARYFAFEWLGRPSFTVPIVARLDSIGLHATATLCRGTSVVAGTSGSEGSWTELVSSTAAEYIGFTLGLQGGGGSIFDSDCVIDFGVGASSSEIAITELTNIPFRSNATEAVQGLPWGHMLPLNRPLPRGVRLSARITGAAASTGTFDIMLLGWVN